MGELPVGVTLNGFTDWLHEKRNDLHKPAAAVAPEIDKALTMMRQQRAVLWAGMSGSGATCVAVVKDMGAARQVARMIQIREQSWWVVPTPLLS